MDDEEAFHKAIEASPEDHLARLVFADWLQDRCDPRAEGYRAMGVNGFRSRFFMDRFKWYNARDQKGGIDTESDLPADWFRATRRSKLQLATDGATAEFETRRQAEDAAALAFAKLPPKRRAKLLAGNPDAK